MKNNLWSLGVHSNPKLLWILNYRIFMGQGNLGLELRSKGIQGVHQFQNRIDPSTSCENFRIRIEGQGIHGVPQFHKRIGSPRLHYTMGSKEI